MIQGTNAVLSSAVGIVRKAPLINVKNMQNKSKVCLYKNKSNFWRLNNCFNRKLKLNLEGDENNKDNIFFLRVITRMFCLNSFTAGLPAWATLSSGVLQCQPDLMSHAPTNNFTALQLTNVLFKQRDSHQCSHLSEPESPHDWLGYREAQMRLTGHVVAYVLSALGRNMYTVTLRGHQNTLLLCILSLKWT